MSDQPTPTTSVESQEGNTALIVTVVVILLITIGLVVLTVFLALNPLTTGPSVRVVRDLLIIVMSVELVVIGVSITVFLVQAARLVNLVNNELQPLIESTSDTVNAVRGTAMFLSKNLADPVIQANSVLRGFGKIAGDVEAIRTAAGIVTSAFSSVSPTGTRSQSSTAPVTEQGVGESAAKSKMEQPPMSEKNNDMSESEDT